MTQSPGLQSEKVFLCPRCNTPTSLNSIRCPNCGAHLATAIARSAVEKASASAGEVGLPYEADRPLPRFGEFLLENGDITKAQLEAALARQTAVPGQHRTIGQILLEMGAVNREQLDRASLAQVRQFQTAMQESREQLASQTRRTQQMEEALVKIAELNLSTGRLVTEISHRLHSLMDQLNSAVATDDLSIRQVLAEMDSCVRELEKATSSET
jgi:hypothetical protein